MIGQQNQKQGGQMTAEAYDVAARAKFRSASLFARVKAVAGAGIGNVLEWYDFTVYAYLAGILGTKFFVAGDENTALLATFAVFGVGFVARPLGGLLIGLFGDKYGRKPALLLTFLMIACSTGLIGVLPTYASVGIAAPILLVLARLMQGLSAGGEWGGAASFLVEWAPAHRRGLYGSLHPCAITLGLLLGSGVTGGLTTTLGSAVMADWGWRIPFLVGALIGPLGFYVRRNVDETPIFKRAMLEPTSAVLETFSMARTMVLAFAFPAVQSVVTYVFVSYFPTFTQKYAGLSPSAALWSTALATLVMGLSCLASGWVSDRTGRRFNMIAACGLLILLSYPLLSLALSSASIWKVILTQSVFTALCGLFLGSMPAALVEMFPTKRRLTGLTTAYNLQSMMFGGFAPFIASWLITQTGAPISLSYFIIFSAFVSGAALLLMPETARKELD
ncbi:MFS transporter [Bradyrhizobium brasilense]|uniref:MFS transporter n=1 Tax=Bradyrhizobium brasilense TaxID=1419277 RepID=UPI001E610462|nr:MFS transporter [Bradyrhizobium brasilense]MCC8969987.1 MFS transporter [Bradyrhizobium brasilense]